MTTNNLAVPSTPNDWFWDNTQHQAWRSNGGSSGFTTGSGNLGRMTQVHARFASVSGSSGSPVAWFNNAYSFHTSQTISAGNTSGGGSLPGTIYASTGQDKPFNGTDQWNFGMWCATGIYSAFIQNSGTSYTLTGSNSSILGISSHTNNYSVYGVGAGDQYAYGTYFVIEFYVRSGSGWLKRFVGIKRGSSDTTRYQLNVRRGSGWTEVGHRGENIEFDPYKEVEIMCRDRAGVWMPGIGRWEGPFYLGNREETLHPRSEIYVVAA